MEYIYIYSSIWNLFPSRALQHVRTRHFLVKLFNVVEVDVTEKGALIHVFGTP